MGALLPYSLITQYFINIHVSSIIVVSCCTTSQTAQLLRHLSQRGITASWAVDNLSPLEVRRSGIVLDLSCNQSKEILHDMSSRKMFGLEMEWLLMSEGSAPEEAELPDLYILPGSSVTLSVTSPSSISFYDTYRITRRLPYKFTLLGAVARDEDVLPQWKRPSRVNYEQNLLTTVSVIHSLDIRKLTDPDVAEEDRWPAIHFPVVVNVAYQLNFKFDLRLESVHGWKFPNGSFEGMIGVMEREEVDFGASGVIMREDRRKHVDYTVDYFEFKTGIIFKQPSLSSVSNIYLLPFSRHVWAACGGLLLFVLIILCIAVSSGDAQTFTPPATFLDMVNIVLGFVCQQGSYLAPVTISGRIVVFVSSLAALFLYTSYSANIVALLQSTSSVLKTLKDLTNSHLGLKVQINEYHLGYFLEAVDEDVITLYNKKVKNQPETFVNGTRGVEFMRTGDFAFCVEFDLAYKQISKTFQEEEKCGLGEMHLFFVPRLSIPVIKRSGHREHFTQTIIWQWESGMLDRISRIWLARRPRCESTGGGYLRVGLKDFNPALKVILVGIIISIWFFLCELITDRGFKAYYRKIKHNQEKIMGDDGHLIADLCFPSWKMLFKNKRF
uniref:Ionotropic receptor 75d n=1 Tax=Adelphocoris lineolatus TaxID=236346 RepID=A0A2I4PGZ3_ADELI|nr:ionotropic receptor 75d [Adelphocoris lineolatus]